ncbi:MAG TPA: hypothetical protein VGE03_06105 [Brevundimonas sp.]
MQSPRHLIIREPQNKPAERLDILLAVVVVELLPIIVVDPAVQLDHQTQRKAGEIDEVWVDGVLPPKMQAVETVSAQGLPEDGLGIGLAFAQATGATGPGCAIRGCPLLAER